MLTEQKHHTMRNATMSCLGTMWVLALLLLCGCSRTSEFRARLMALDSVLVQHPDSVYDVMVKMEAEAHGQSQTDRMYYELLRADAQNKAYVDFTTDSVMAEVADWYDRHGTPNEQMRAHYLLGCTYRDLGDVPMELQCFLDATTKADTASKDCDLYTLGAVYGQMANIYHSQYLPEEELKALDMCEKVALLDKDTITAISAYELRLRPFDALNIKDSVLSISKIARAKYLSIGQKERAAKLLCPAISILIDQKQYKKACSYMREFEQESGYITDNGLNKKASVFYYSKGRYYLHKNNIDSAIICFNNLIIEDKHEAAYHGLLSVYEKLNIPDSIAKYARLYAAANDSCYVGKNSEMIEQMTAMYNYGRVQSLQKETAEKLSQSQQQRILLFCLVMALIVLLYAGYFIYNRRRRKTIEEIKRLNREIEHKTSLLNEAMQTADNSDNAEELQSLRTSLEVMQLEMQKYRKTDSLAAFYDSDTYKLFRRLSSSVNNRVTADEWYAMTRLFNSTFSHYAEFIHAGRSVTEDQVRVCMLMRMGFGETEMANILNVDLKRISRIKQQINQKLFGINNAKDLLQNLKQQF